MSLEVKIEIAESLVVNNLIVNIVAVVVLD